MDSIKTVNKLQNFLKSKEIQIGDYKENSIKTLIDLGKSTENFGLLLKEIIIEDNLLLDDFLYTANVLFNLGNTIPPQTFLSRFKNSLAITLKKEGKSALIYQKNDVLIGEIVSVFTSLTLTDDNETVETLLGNFQWYKEYKDPLGIIK